MSRKAKWRGKVRLNEAPWYEKMQAELPPRLRDLKRLYWKAKKRASRLGTTLEDLDPEVVKRMRRARLLTDGDEIR